MKSWLLLTLTLVFVSSCAPADPNAKTVRQRVLAGEAVRLSKRGDSLCGKSAWTDMRLSDADERERVVLKKQSSVLNPGHSTCYRVGDTVALNVFGRQLQQAGRVRIEALTLVLLDKLRANNMKGGFFASSMNFDQYLNAVKLRQKPDQEGIVTIVDVTYLKGSAADEAALRQKDNDASQGDGYVETTKDGELLPGSSCKARFTYLAIPPELQTDFTSGKLQSWYSLFDYTCVSQGQIVDLSVAKGAPPTAQVKISKIKKFRVKALDPKFFVMAPGYDFAAIRTRVAKDNSKGSEWMVVVDFVLVPPPLLPLPPTLLPPTAATTAGGQK